MTATFAPSDVVVVTSRGKRRGRTGTVAAYLADADVPAVYLVRFEGEPGRHAYYPEELAPLESTNAAEAPARAIDGESQSAGRHSQNEVPNPTKENEAMSIIASTVVTGNAQSSNPADTAGERAAELTRHFPKILPSLWGDAMRFTLHNPTVSIDDVVAQFTFDFEPPADELHVPTGATDVEDWEPLPFDGHYRRFTRNEARPDGKTVSLDHCQYAHADGTVETVEMSLDLSAYDGLPLRSLDEARSLVTALETIIAAEEA